MMNVLLVGATGMVGQGVLGECLLGYQRDRSFLKGTTDADHITCLL
jgi:hypothetical protein